MTGSLPIAGRRNRSEQAVFVPAYRARRSLQRMILKLVALLLVSPASFAYAQSLDCTVSSTSIAFGTYDPMSSTPRDSSAQITVDCRRTNTVAFIVSLSTGNSGSYSPRAMSSGSNKLNYNLYLDASRSTVFGDGSSGTEDRLCYTGITYNGCIGSNPSSQGRRAVLPFYGRIPAGQDAASGLYSDTVQVTIIF